MRRSVVAFVMILCAVTVMAQEVRNPFTSSGPAPRSSVLGSASPFSAAVFSFLAPMQRALNESLTAVTKSLQGSQTLGGLLLVLALSLVYGIFHAAGPGHGKTIVSSYFLANEVKLPQVLLVGNLIALVHAAAALSVVLVLSVLVRGLFSTGVEQANLQIQRVSFALIAVIGLYLLVQRIRGAGHHHGHDHERHGSISGRTGLRGLLAIALPAGMIPCPGAVAVIIFALSLHMLWVSVLSVIAMSVGMGMTISLAALLVVLAKRGFLRLLGGHHGERETAVRKVVEITGAAALVVLGSLLFISQF